MVAAAHDDAGITSRRTIRTYLTEDLSTAVRVDLLQPTAEEMERVRRTGLRVPTESEISGIESTSRLGFEKGAYYVSTPLVAPRETASIASRGRVRVLVARAAHGAIRAAAVDRRRTGPRIEQRTKTPRRRSCASSRSSSIARPTSLEHAGAECDELSRGAFRSGTRGSSSRSRPRGSALRRVGGVAERIRASGDGLLGLGRIGAYVMESGFEGAPPVNATRLKAIRADVASLTDYEAHLSGKVQFLLDATLGFINIEQNEIVKTLTIASVVGIPPVLVAGIYGMNFRLMPELGWRFGYPLAAVIVVSALLPLWWFKRRGWM